MYRIRLGLSQEAVAVRTGLHRTYISAVERGKRSISLDNIQRIADALEIETYLLFIDDTNPLIKPIERGDESCHV
nr:helix-turn-helix transcriptional regulator [Bacteroides acidifaciens]